MKVYEIITQNIIEKLETGNIPWHKAWASSEEMPKNLISKKDYRGINVFILAAMGYESPYWLTFKQATELGGTITKGQKGTPIVFWKWLTKENDEGKEENIPMLRYYTVFNISQCEGIDESKIPVINTVHNNFNAINDCEMIVTNMQKCPEVTHNEQRAYYRPSSDTVNMPRFDSFDSAEEYYSTLFHELTHSTSHESRLNRRNASVIRHFGDCDYSKEELVAEMGAAFLCGITGIVNKTIDNSAAYIKGWLKSLRNDTKLVIMAAAQAQKAADYITNKQ